MPMGPMNEALVAFYEEDQKLRELEGRLDAATRSVRVQRRRVGMLQQQHDDLVSQQKQAQAQAMELESDLKARDARIEHLREQQQAADAHKQYQAFLVEINTQKVDRAKVEEQAIAKMGESEQLQQQIAQIAEQVKQESETLATMETAIGDRVSMLESQINEQRPKRDAKANDVPPKAMEAYERLADRFEGEAMAPLAMVNPKIEAYYCTACNIELVVDVYNRLRTRDELANCPGCGRLLYIPEELTPEVAVLKGGKKKTTRKKAEPKERKTAKRSTKAPKIERTGVELKGAWKRILQTSEAESLRAASEAETSPVELEVFVNAQSVGTFRAKDREHFERLVRGRLQAEDVEGVMVIKETSDGQTGASAGEASDDTIGHAGQPTDDETQGIETGVQSGVES